MKNLLLVISMVLLLASCTSEKVAYVEMDEIYKEYDKAKEAEAEMTAKSQQMLAGWLTYCCKLILEFTQEWPLARSLGNREWDSTAHRNDLCHLP